MFGILRETLPADRISADLAAVLSEGHKPVELGDDRVVVPSGAELTVVARSVHTYEVRIGFGDHYRVLVAVGGIDSVEHGIVRAGICFATLWYSTELKLITVDFAKEMP